PSHEPAVFGVEQLLAPLLKTKHRDGAFGRILRKIFEPMPAIVHDAAERKISVAPNKTHEAFGALLDHSARALGRIRHHGTETIILRSNIRGPRLTFHPPLTDAFLDAFAVIDLGDACDTAAGLIAADRAILGSLSLHQNTGLKPGRKAGGASPGLPSGGF